MKTGPRTPEGKAISSQNATTHGVYARQLRLRDEEKPEYEALEAGLRDELNPASTLQNEIFTRILRVYWVLRRLDRREDDVYFETGLPLEAAQPKEFENSLRHRRFLAKELRDLREEFESLQAAARAQARNTATSASAYTPITDFAAEYGLPPLDELPSLEDGDSEEEDEGPLLPRAA